MGRKKIQLNLLGIKAEGVGNMAEEKKKNKEEERRKMFDFNVLNPLLYIFDMKGKKKATQI